MTQQQQGQITTTTTLWIPFVLFTALLLLGVCVSNVQRQRNQIVMERPERVMRGSFRWTVVLSALVYCIGLSYVIVDASTSLQEYLLHDMYIVQNAVHAGFMTAGWTNYMMTGNVRYLYISRTLLMAVLVVLLGRLWHNNDDEEHTNDSEVAVVWMFVALTVVVLIAQSWAWKHCHSSVFLYRTNLLEEGETYVETHTRDRGVALRYKWMRGVALWGCHLEFVCLIWRNFFVAASSSSSTTSGDFIHAYNMGIHVGWTLGNGYHGVLSNSLKNLRLFGLAKIVFGMLSVTQFITCRDDSTVNGVYCVVQLVTLYAVNELRVMLNTIQFDTDRFIPPGKSSEAITEQKNVFDMHVGGYWAGIGACGCFCLFLVESTVVIVGDPSMETMSAAANYALHGCAVFMLTFQRVVMDEERLLQMRKNIYKSMFALFALVSLCGALSGAATRGAFDAVTLFASARCIVLGVAIYGYSILRPKQRVETAEFIEEEEEEEEGRKEEEGEEKARSADSNLRRLWREEEGAIKQQHQQPHQQHQQDAEQDDSFATKLNVTFFLACCAVCIGEVVDNTNAHAAYGIAFHFCFVVFGYGLRGIRGANINFLQFSSLSMAVFGVCLLLTALLAPSNAMLASVRGILFAASLVTFFNVASLQWFLRYVHMHLDQFPQTGFAVT